MNEDMTAELPDVIELYPLADDSGQPETRGSCWGWRLISQPGRAVLDACVESAATQKAARSAALKAHRGVDVVVID